MSDSLIEFIRDIYQTSDFIPLHAPQFNGNEKKFVLDAIDSTFVSSVGKYVDKFESKIKTYTGAERAVATVNGTAALHASLILAGVEPEDLVITQSLTFVATCNVLRYMGVQPIFVDISKISLGLCPEALGSYLDEFAYIDSRGQCRSSLNNQRIKAVMPMHTFGHPVQLDELLKISKKWNLVLIEDAAESLGSFYKGRHTGTFGRFSALSFNGNKIITTGGGGMILCGSSIDGDRAKHLTTTAKVPHEYEYFHDEAGFNYRLPNINSALGCAQMESLNLYLKSKRKLALEYREFFRGSNYQFVDEPEYSESNFWLNAIVCEDNRGRDLLLELTNSAGVMTRPVWTLMHKLPMYKSCMTGPLKTSEFFEQRLVNLPSTPRVLPLN